MAIADLPLLDWNRDVTYLGAFRVPQGTYGESRLDNGCKSMAYDPSTDTLLAIGGVSGSGLGQGICRITIPSTLSLSSNYANLPFAVPYNAGGFRRFDMGRAKDVPNWPSNPNELGFLQVPGGATWVTGLMLYQGDLYITATDNYDADGSNIYSHCKMNLAAANGDELNATMSEWNRPVFSPAIPSSAFNGPTPGPQGHMYLQNQASVAGYVAGYMCEIPSEWRAELGNYKAFSGLSNSTVSIVSRLSAMQAAFAWNPEDIQQTYTAPVPFRPLQYTGAANPFFIFSAYQGYTYGAIGSGASYRFTSAGHLDWGMVAIPGTRTYLYSQRGPRPNDYAMLWYGRDQVTDPPDGLIVNPQAYASSVGPPRTHQVINGGLDNGLFNTGVYSYHCTEWSWSGGSPGSGTPTNTGVNQYVGMLQLWDALNLKGNYDGSLPPDAGRPYAYVDLSAAPSVQFDTLQGNGGGVCYDAVTNRLFVADIRGAYNSGGNNWWPVIRVYDINIPGGGPPPSYAENKRPYTIGF